MAALFFSRCMFRLTFAGRPFHGPSLDVRCTASRRCNSIADFRQDTELLPQPQAVTEVPDLDDLAATEAKDVDARIGHRPARWRQAIVFALLRAVECPEHHHSIPFGYHLVDSHAPVAPDRAQPGIRRLLTLGRRLHRLGRDACPLQGVELKAGSKDLVTGPRVVWGILKVAANQGLVLFDSHRFLFTPYRNELASAVAGQLHLS